jgi:paired amphipathic helix protein Sin3a
MSATGAEWVHFFPCKTDDPHFRVFYASSGLYLFFRYFYTIYQRLEIAKEISFKFDSNAKTEGLGIQERYILGVKRYKLFKSALFHSLGTKEFKYEDYLRSIYAK